MPSSSFSSAIFLAFLFSVKQMEIYVVRRRGNQPLRWHRGRRGCFRFIPRRVRLNDCIRRRVRRAGHICGAISVAVFGSGAIMARGNLPRFAGRRRRLHRVRHAGLFSQRNRRVSLATTCCNHDEAAQEQEGGERQYGRGVAKTP